MIFTAIATALLSAFSITSTFAIGLTAAALEVGSGIAISLLGKAISGANSTSASQFAVQGTLQAAGDIERSFPVGIAGTAGSLAYANTWGNVNQTPNAYLTQVICVSDLPIAGLSQVWVGGLPVSVDWTATPAAQGYPVLDYRTNGVFGANTDHMWVRFYDGTQTAADSFLTGTFGSSSSAIEVVTISIASPAVITLAAHGFYAGLPIVFNTNGALPTGLVAGQTYYVSAVGLTVNTFQVSVAPGGASVVTSGTQSGTQSVTRPIRPYDSTRVGKGCAYVIVTALVNDGLFSGFPTFMFGLEGIKLYDITKDSTAGGSGTHRLSDPTTWGGDGDLLSAVQIYNLLAGIGYGGAWFYGLQNMPVARLPNDSWVAVVNKCRATITEADGAVPTYRSGGEIGVNATIADTITTLLTTCQGRLSEVGGVYKLDVGAPGSAVYSFDDDIILDSEVQTFTPFFGLADTINGITAKYPSPTSGWQTVVAPPLYNAAYQVLDGNRQLLADVSLDFVPYDEQVQRLMLSALQEARRARRHTFILPSDAWVLEPGDIVAYSSVRNGYTSKLFRLDGIVDKANLDVILDMTEVDPADYAWVTGTNFTAPTEGILVPGKPAPQPVTGFAVAPATINDASGTQRRPTIQMTWDGAQPDVQAVLWQVRLAADSSLAASGQITDVTTGSGILPPVFLPSTAYQVRIKYQPYSQRETLWSDQPAGTWLSVTTGNVGTDIPDFGPQITALVNFYNTAIADLQTSIGQIGSILDSQDFANFQDKQQLTNKVTSQVGSAVAISGELFAVATSAIAAEATARIAAMAGLGSAFAGGLLEFDSSVTGGGAGATATIAAKVRANVGDVAAQGGWMWKATSDGTTATLEALLQQDRLYLVDGAGNIVTAITFDLTTGAITAASINLGSGAVLIDHTGITVTG